MVKKVVDILNCLKTRIKINTINEIVQFARAKKPKLWAKNRPVSFIKKSVYMALYKDLYGIGYEKLQREFKGIIDVAKKSIIHNVQHLRTILKEWGKSKVQLGTLADWNASVKHHKFKKQVAGVNLWIDSTDFAMPGKRRVSRKKGDWSYKCNSPGRRYMFINDGRVVRKIIGGYSPKIYDGKVLELNRDVFENIFAGATIVGDQHFQWGKKNLKGVTVHTPIKNKPRNGKHNQEDEIVSLTKDETKYNAAVRTARAQVETPFGIIDRKFESLRKYWPESADQMDALIYIAAGIMNSESEAK